MEEPHAHDWRVHATIAGGALDDDDLLCDFHAVEASLDAMLDRWRDADLNHQPPFAGGPLPTAERVAEAIAAGLALALRGVLPEGAHVRRVAVTEAPGCEAAVTPGEAAQR